MPLPEGTPWRVGLVDPERPGALTEPVDLVDRAVATSAGAGFRFDAKGRFTHLFDPTTGRNPSRYNTVSIMAPTAAEADALSTAFSLMPCTKMIYAGLKDEQKTSDLVAFLKQFDGDGKKKWRCSLSCTLLLSASVEGMCT